MIPICLTYLKCFNKTFQIIHHPIRILLYYKYKRGKIESTKQIHVYARSLYMFKAYSRVVQKCPKHAPQKSKYVL